MERLAPRLYSWASVLEEKTRAQAVMTATMPFIHPHLALMPDAHLGKGATVGSVIPTLGAIMPAAVGVDIGCGMMAVRTGLTKDAVLGRGDLPKLREHIEQAIPLSAGKYNQAICDEGTKAKIADLEAKDGAASAQAIAPNWRLQLGSLGSGNHFIEICLDEEDQVWLFLHSGSRGVGNKLAQKHIRKAQAYLVEGTHEFWDYIRDLRWAQHFAKLNRLEMMQRLGDAVEWWLCAPFECLEVVHCHHNYTMQEEHFGKKVWLSRKGAIDASAGTRGLIPGSMGTRSYVVTGKGNKMSLNSSPHGAGREYSRSAARRQFTMAELETAMEGIEWRRTDAFLDEIPGAYKDVEVVIRDAAELVQVEHTLRQILNVKGD